MSQIIPIYIPTLISDINYNPAKVYPRLFFYNGKVECQPYYFEHKTASGSAAIQTTELDAFPYVDHYNVVTGSFPSADSKTLLFLNEEPVYGSAPSQSLYTEYWETYINLLYDPKTRLIACSAIIPLADYYQMELNDLVEWRGNTYHLRAINSYDIKSGKCALELLGPIIRDAQSQQINCNFTFVSSNVPTTTITPTGVPTTLVPTTTLAPTTLVPTTTQCPVDVNSCLQYTFTNINGPNSYNFTYLPCGSRTITTGNVPNGASVTVCAVSGAVRTFNQISEADVCNGITIGRTSTTDISVSVGSACSATPTTTITPTVTPTTSTTTATPTATPTTAVPTTTNPANRYYVVQYYPCPTCAPQGGSQIGISSVALTNGYFYGYPGSGACYQVQTEVATTSWSIDLNYMSGFPSCGSYCST
jgi:hypothetical protein